MTEPETWVRVDEKGKEHTTVVYDPGSYLKGWTWLYLSVQNIAGTSPLYLYLQLTGKYKAEEILAVNDGKRTPAQDAISSDKNIFVLLVELYKLFQLESFAKLNAAQTAGNISPELAKIINYQPPVADNVINSIMGGDYRVFNEIVLNAVNDGTVDFTAFNDTGDTSPDWFLKYRLSPVPVPGYYGMVESLRKDAMPGVKQSVLEYNKHGVIETIKRYIKNALENGTTPETLLIIADEIKKRYEANKKAGEKNYINSAFPYTSKRLAGFVVDVVDGVVFDLRPHVDELRELAAPGVEPLKEFYQLIKQQLRLYKNKTAAPAEVQGTFSSLTTDIPFVPLRANPETVAIAKLTSKIESLYIQQELPGLDEQENTLYNYHTAVKTKKGEVIVKIRETTKGKALTPSAQKLKLLCEWLYNKTGSRMFGFSVAEYMEKCGKKVTKETKKDFKKALIGNIKTWLKTTVNINSKGKFSGEIGIIAGYRAWRGDIIEISLTPEYCALLDNKKNGGLLRVTDYIFRSDERNPHIIPVIMTLALHRGIIDNIVDGTANRLKIKTLVDNTPELLLKLKKKSLNGRYRELIIEPLINVIKILNDDGVIKSSYIDKDGNKHTDDELNFVGIDDFLDGEKWLLEFEFIGYKDDPEAIAKVLERRKKREEKRIQDAAKRLANKKLKEAQK